MVDKLERAVIGITKELNEDEKTTYTSPTTELLFLKENVQTKIVGWEKKQFVISMCRGIIYLTNQRLIILKLFEVPGVSSGQKKNLLAGSAGSFFDISLKDISYIKKRPIVISRENIARFGTVFGADEHQVNGGPSLEIGYNERTTTLKNESIPLWDVLFVLGDPMFTLESVMREHLKGVATRQNSNSSSQ